MPAIHTNIPTAILPTELTDPNKIVTHYESYTLIPRLGPLSYTYLRLDVWRRLGFLQGTLLLLNRMEIHKKTWNYLPVVSPALMNAVTSATVPVEFTPPTSGANIEASTVLRGVRTLNADNITTLSGADPSGTRKTSVEEVPRTESHNEILSLLNRPNPVVSQLVRSGNLVSEQGAIREDLLRLDTEKRLSVIIDETNPTDTGRPTELQTNLARNMVDNVVANGKTLFGELGATIKKSPEARDKVTGHLAGILKLGSVFESLNSLDDTVIVDSREWAFLRRERVELLLQQPQYRGPLSINSVAPNSELFVSDSQVVSNQRFDVTASQRASSSASNLLISNQIKEKLGTLYDYGSNLGQTMSEQGYERDSTRGEKRSIIEATLREVSESNASQTISVSSITRSNLREYRTEGKDTEFATTEVSFEAFTPVKVTHFLEGIGAVWCPRIKNPYRVLKETIEDFEDQVRSEYITENYIIDLTEPLPTYEGFERVSVNTEKITGDQVDDDDDGTIYEDIVTIELSEAQKNQNYFLASDMQCEFHQDDPRWTNDFDSDQYRILDPEVLEHVENSHIRIKTKLKVLDEPNGANPDSIWLSVSVSRYKYTEAYLEQLKEYRNTVNEINPARRAAVEAQAKRYARLKKEELIQRYEDNPDELKEYTFVTLMRQMFGNTGGDWSYYHGIIKTCIDWDRATIQPEPAAPEQLEADGLSPFHFLNVNAVRFFLPIHEGSEEAFFEAVSNTLDKSWKDLFKKVKEYIDRQREIVAKMTERMNDEDRKKLTLDEYDSELVLGRHLEAVLSKTTFLES